MLKRKKCLFFLQSGVGGAERMTVLIARSLNQVTHEVIFYVIDRPLGSSNIIDFIPDTYTVNKLPKAYGMHLLNQFRHVLKKEKPDDSPINIDDLVNWRKTVKMQPIKIRNSVINKLSWVSQMKIIAEQLNS